MMVSNEKRKFSKDGSVVRITMKNFMIYKHETIWPGPNFNVMVGPNGSGKSTVVTAIAVCLGGDISILNRQGDVTSLVNQSVDTEEATVELELYRREGGNIVLGTSIVRGRQPVQTWTIGGRPAERNRLLALTDSLQIQPGNLCQFLPQDVVRQFPLMTPQQVFKNTMKAIGDASLQATYENLKNLQAEIEGWRKELITKQNTLSSLQQKELRHRDTKNTYDKRKLYEDKLLTVENSIKWKLFYKCRQDAIKAKEDCLKKDEALTKMKEKEQELIHMLARYLEKESRAREMCEQADERFSELTGLVMKEQEEMEELSGAAGMAEEKRRDLELAEQQHHHKVAMLRHEVANLTQHQNSRSAAKQQLEARQSELTASRQRYSENLLHVEAKLDDVDIEVAKAKKEMKELERTLDSLNSVRMRKLEFLRHENPDTYHAIMWLQENREKFKAPVHEPIMLCLQVKDASYVPYLESHVGFRDLEGFICEDPDDVSLFIEETRIKRNWLKVNIFHSNPEDPARFRKPDDEKELQKYQLISFLCDMYEAPAAVHAYLCRQKNLHKVPVFSNNCEDSEKLQEDFSTFYAGDLKYYSKISKYSNQRTTVIDEIGRKTLRLGGRIDKAVLEQTQSRLSTLRLHLNQELAAQRAVLLAEKGKIEVDQAACHQELNTKEEQLREIAARNNELASKRDTLRRLQEAAVKSDGNLAAELASIKATARQACVRAVQQASRLVVTVERLAQADLQRGIAQLQARAVKSENSEQKEKLDELSRQVVRAAAELADLTRERDGLLRQMKEKYTAAAQATGVNPERKTLPPEVWKKKFEFLPSELHTLEVLRQEDKERLRRVKEIPSHKLADIEENLRLLAETKAEVDKLETKIGNAMDQCEQFKANWIGGLKRRVDEVGTCFSNMMAELGYAGHIQLNEGKRDLDFNNYGLKIMVKFKPSDDLVELSKGAQSGGEKSVTTAVYMMALQELTQVPFRCVDEINQGMDERNERAVWGMLLRVCSKYQAQYFYMAPKFPYSLPFDNQVNIHVCNSGLVRKRNHTDFSMHVFRKLTRLS